eukprot:TRINITY_DN799_c0_g1_i1.p1 TRINITY_DN799_c0_g1~~TRINITY_DN799_c0_g1_i1.p1  ORF type:complete len:244 (+),score=73.10 TRINITY_DN799_c0_g1_i1:98-829(+)
MASGNQKCIICGKTVYPMELVNHSGDAYHKFCFKCSVCKGALTLKNANKKEGQLFCEKHLPKDKPTATADRHDLNTIKNAPKPETVNQQVRGELAGQASKEGVDSVGIGGRINAPKVDKVNQQVRGELAGQKPQEDVNSLRLQNALNAPKPDVVNEQVRGALAGQKPSVDAEALNIKNALAAPKPETINEQVRGALAGQKPQTDINSLGIQSATTAPKVEAHLGIQRGDASVELAKPGAVYHA